MVDHPQQSPELFGAYNKEPRPLETGRRALASSVVWSEESWIVTDFHEERRGYNLETGLV